MSDRVVALGELQAELVDKINNGNAQDVLDFLDRLCAIPLIPLFTWRPQIPDDAVANLRKSATNTDFARRDLIQIADQHLPAAWYGAAAANASAAISGAAAASERISGALDAAARVLESMYDDVQNAAKKDLDGQSELSDARLGLQNVVTELTVANNHGIQVQDAAAQVVPWYQLAQSGMRKRVDAANQASNAASTAGTALAQYGSAAAYAPGLFPGLNTATDTSVSLSGPNGQATLMNLVDKRHDKSVVLTATVDSVVAENTPGAYHTQTTAQFVVTEISNDGQNVRLQLYNTATGTVTWASPDAIAGGISTPDGRVTVTQASYAQ